MHNNLFLNRLVIITNEGKIAYDEFYRRGVNIIRGENSSGKSTITHFIFYVLGGHFNDWVKEAKKCSHVIAEVEMNGAVLTLKREINVNENTGKANPIEGIYIFWGNFEDSKINSQDWYKFNFNTAPEKKSFSNVFFENLDIPIVKGENNITFHQVLRLLYIDQDSPTSSLFLYEQFDSSLTRETVAELLLGVYKQELYDNRFRKNQAEVELDDTKREIKTIKQFFPNAFQLDSLHLQTSIDNKEKEISLIEDEIIELKEKEKIVRFTGKTQLEFETINKEALAQRQRVNTLANKISTLKYEIADTSYFIEILQKKIKAVSNSILARDFLGDFPLGHCPECLSEIKKNEIANSCKLCKETIDKSYGITQARKIEQDLGFQIQESSSIMIKSKRELSELEITYNSEKEKLFHIQTRVNAALKDIRSVREEKIDRLLEDKGFIEGEILQLRTLFETANLFEKLTAQKNVLENELESLKLSINKMTNDQFAMKQKTNNAIEKKALVLLNNDLKRQDDFIEAKEFHIDYSNNIAFISDKNAKYSASSNFYLKTSARFSIFLASLEIEEMRYPRFIFSDNMEDKGIEEGRAHNFQHIIIEEAEKHPDESFQMIYTTSHIPEDLNNSKYCIGDFYTKESPSLKYVND